ncbi:YggT family protein [Sphingomonas sp.]|jgi:YggT family protein|uniref:YggT family protein n=1 Tax=Sphingomonas sp. TaxID=28214 RepID=UPI002D7E25A1|nr:YggT family protein [Sphingomonas sp.]HEU0045593.1 YggT family protein [Sphingomonas sp.]
MGLIFLLADYLLMILQVVIFVQVILSWLLAFNVVNRHSQFVGGLVQGLDRLTEPLYRPIRRILPDFGAIDLAPLVVLLVVSFLRSRALPYLALAAGPEVL